MLIKICGMKYPDNIRQVAELHPDMMGFIFYPGSPRYVGKMETQMILKLPENITRVAVFVNETYTYIRKIVERYNITTIQLHGQESPEFCGRLQEEGFQVIKAMGIRESTDFIPSYDYERVCDYLLFDTKSPDYGGSGQTFDWEILSVYQGKCPFLLSGGIGPDAMETIRKISHPCFAGIDLNSRFERSPACKDMVLLSRFLNS